MAIIVVLIILGDIAINTQQWFWTRSATLGIYIGNHPIEAIIQSSITPLFIISVWEFIKRKK